MKNTTLAIAAIALMLTGCASQPQEAGEQDTVASTAPDTTAAEPTTSDRWAFDYYGGCAEFTLPTEEPNSEWAQQVMDYRAEAGIEEPIYWTTIEADNTNGTQDFTADGFIFVTDDGQQIQSVESASDLLDEAQESIDDTDFYNRGVDLYNERTDPIKPGAKGDIPVAFYEQAEPAIIYVVDGLSGELEAYPLP